MKKTALLLVALGMPACEDSAAGAEGESEAESEGESEAEAESEGESESEAEAEGEAEAEAEGEGGCPTEAECSNGIDDDKDGDIDGFDAECTGGCDDDEGSFATGIPGDNQDGRWQDCFFDGNSGSAPMGLDDCRYHTCCLYEDIADCTEGGYSGPEDCEVSKECVAFCSSGTTPGCDCFGCCTVCVDGTCHDVIVSESIAPDCDVSVIDDPDLCPPCVPSDLCGTPCGASTCELCPGQSPKDLPKSCGGTVSCPAGLSPCDIDADCAMDFYCASGCCVELIVE